MRSFFVIFFVALCLALPGCRDGGEAPRPVAVQTPLPPSAGDSDSRLDDALLKIASGALDEARELIAEGLAHGGAEAAAAGRVSTVVEGILARPEHAWFEQGAEEQTRLIREQMEDRYGQ